MTWRCKIGWHDWATRKIFSDWIRIAPYGTISRLVEMDGQQCLKCGQRRLVRDETFHGFLKNDTEAMAISWLNGGEGA